MRRLRVTLGGKVGLRMGDGTRDETKDTVITFVTCGYMVRLMSHNPEALEHFTHIIIDEVHERSVDGDVACMLCKGLLKRFPYLRLVLMSATLNTGLYRNYFSEFVSASDLEPLFVGVKRFNITFKYCEDILQEYQAANVPEARRESVRKLIDMTCKIKSSREVTPSPSR
jgi:HrpA-like RNA helicase